MKHGLYRLHYQKFINRCKFKSYRYSVLVCLFVFFFLAESKMAIKEAMCFLLLVMSVVAKAEHSGKERSNIAIIIIECLYTTRVNTG